VSACPISHSPSAGGLRSNDSEVVGGHITISPFFSRQRLNDTFTTVHRPWFSTAPPHPTDPFPIFFSFSLLFVLPSPRSMFFVHKYQRRMPCLFDLASLPLSFIAELLTALYDGGGVCRTASADRCEVPHSSTRKTSANPHLSFPNSLFPPPFLSYFLSYCFFTTRFHGAIGGGLLAFFSNVFFEWVLSS